MATNKPDTQGYLIALASLPGVGPARLRALVAAWTPAGAWQRVTEGRALAHPLVAARAGSDPQTLTSSWRRASASIDPAALSAAHLSAGVQVLHRCDEAFPERLVDDPDPPELLYVKGRRELLDGVCVAIVGTRHCSRYGHDVARKLARELSEAGVSIVSGLAAGIDGAAHQGALDASPGAARPIGVVGSGLDVVYPLRHRELWRRVTEEGVMVSESPLGTRPEPWRFPARNRIIAALSRVVIVVESASTGGSLLTVSEAHDRGLDVMAVPGPITSPASEGTNRLISDGAAPVLCTGDVLEALGIDRSVTAPDQAARAALVPEQFDATPETAMILDVLGAQARNLSEITALVELPFATVAVTLSWLEASGQVARRGGYYERSFET